MRSMLFEIGILAFARTALSGLPAIADPWVDEDPGRPMTNCGVVAKTVVSDDFRFFILAGLEGSGHHYILNAARAVLRSNHDLPRIERHLDTDPWYLPDAMGGKVSHYAEASLQGKEEMQRLAEEAAGFPYPTVHFPELPLSYPRYSGPDKAMQYVDLKRIAEDAESAGIDLRVVYLKRSAQDMIVANTVHRNFQERLVESWRDVPSEGTLEEHFLKYVRMFFTDIGVLQAFLGELDPKFVVCHDWDLLGDEKQASDIATFVAPNNEVADMVRAALVVSVAAAKRVHGDGDAGRDIDEMTFDGAETLLKRLQDKLDSFEARYCGAPNQAV